MSFDSFLRPRPEVLNDTIEGIVDLANLQEPGKLESEPGRFFSITYPTADTVRVLQALDARFDATQSGTPGLFLFEGLKGSGKSHLLLLVYHLFEHRDEADAWLASHNLTCRLPRDVTVIVNKFTDQPTGSIWDLIYHCMTGQNRGAAIVQPGLDEMKQVIGDRRLVLILDELERGVRSISDDAVQAQNLAFLQMLSEWANRSSQVTLLASVYSDEVEPGATLKRVSPVRVQFQHAQDREKVVLYRLFENYLEFDPRAIRSVVDSYINVWRRQVAFSADEYAAQMLASFPFSPDLLTLLLDRVPARGGFQNVRGALGFLGRLVHITRGSANLITPGTVALSDREVALRLSDLDPNQLLQRARSNLSDLNSLDPRPPLLDKIASATLLFTVTGSGRNIGATREELIRSVMQPGVDINDFERAMLAMQRYAANFHVASDRFYFDQTETPDAKVELRALPKGDPVAREELRTILRELFNSDYAVVFTQVTETREALEALDRNDLRFVLAPRVLSAQERHELYFGLPMRNQVILLEPGERTFNLIEHPDLLKWAKRHIAAGELANLSQGDVRRVYERIGQADHTQITDHLKRVGLRYVRFETYGSSAAQDEVDEEALGRAMTAQEVRTILSTQLYPSELITEHLRDRLNELLGRTVREIEQEYKATLGFPVPAKAHSLTDAIESLCADERRLISLRHATRGSFCGERPALRYNELLEATIEAPLDRAALSRPSTITTLITQGTRPQPPADIGSVGLARPVDVATVTPTESGSQEEVRILPQPSPGQLRQEIAFRLQDKGEERISRVRFAIFGEQSHVSLGQFSTGLRGSLTGEGDLSAEIRLTFQGEYTKAAVEQMVEQLPLIPGGEYSATLWIR